MKQRKQIRRNPMARDLLTNGLYRSKTVKTQVGRGSYTRKPKHRVENE